MKGVFAYIPEHSSWTQFPWSKFLFNYYLEKYTSEMGLEADR